MARFFGYKETSKIMLAESVAPVFDVSNLVMIREWLTATGATGACTVTVPTGEQWILYLATGIPATAGVWARLMLYRASAAVYLDLDQSETTVANHRLHWDDGEGIVLDAGDAIMYVENSANGPSLNVQIVRSQV